MEDNWSPFLRIIADHVHLDAVCLFRADFWRARLEPVALGGDQTPPCMREAIDITGEIAEKLAVGDATDLDSVLPEAWRRFPRRFTAALQYEAPLRGASPVGLLASARISNEEFTPSEVAFLTELRPLLADALASSLLHRELTDLRSERDELRQKLANRKIIERAKGVLQARAGLTEEQAYLELRRMSRQSRATLAETASRIVDQPRPAERSRVRRLSA
jgi:hypothetical protein